MKRMNQFVYALLIGCVLLTGCGSNTNTTETKEEVQTPLLNQLRVNLPLRKKMIPLQDGLKV